MTKKSDVIQLLQDTTNDLQFFKHQKNTGKTKQQIIPKT